MLLKVGFWALILKFWKLILGAIVAAWYGIKKILAGRKKNEEEYQVAEEVVKEKEVEETTV